LLERFTPAFKKFNPAFERDWVKEGLGVQDKIMPQPVPLVNHSRNIPTIETPIEGLIFASMSQVLSMGPRHELCSRDRRRAARLMK